MGGFNIYFFLNKKNVSYCFEMLYEIFFVFSFTYLTNFGGVSRLVGHFCMVQLSLQLLVRSFLKFIRYSCIWGILCNTFSGTVG